jgi:hypothetical protein
MRKSSSATGEEDIQFLRNSDKIKIIKANEGAESFKTRARGALVESLKKESTPTHRTMGLKSYLAKGLKDLSI